MYPRKKEKKNSFRVHKNYNFYPFAYNFYPYFSASRTWTHAFPCNTKCGNCTAIPTLQRNQAGQYSWRRYRRWEPKAHPGTHMDYHPSLPGRKFIHSVILGRNNLLSLLSTFVQIIRYYLVVSRHLGLGIYFCSVSSKMDLPNIPHSFFMKSM